MTRSGPRDSTPVYWCRLSETRKRWLLGTVGDSVKVAHSNAHVQATPRCGVIEPGRRQNGAIRPIVPAALPGLTPWRKIKKVAPEKPLLVCKESTCAFSGLADACGQRNKAAKVARTVACTGPGVLRMVGCVSKTPGVADYRRGTPPPTRPPRAPPVSHLCGSARRCGWFPHAPRHPRRRASAPPRPQLGLRPAFAAAPSHAHWRAGAAAPYRPPGRREQVRAGRRMGGGRAR